MQGIKKKLVDLVGIEPTTSSMPWKRAPSCATGPLAVRSESFNFRARERVRQLKNAAGALLRFARSRANLLNTLFGTAETVPFQRKILRIDCACRHICK